MRLTSLVPLSGLRQSARRTDEQRTRTGGSGSSWTRRIALLVGVAVATRLVRRLRSRRKRSAASDREATPASSGGGSMLRKAGLFVGTVGAAVAARALRRRLTKSATRGR